MKLIVGIDEAGYGPNMGPLVIGASVWQVPNDHQVEGTLESMAPEFRAEPWNEGSPFVPLGDSKKIYRSGLTTSGLETGVLYWNEHTTPKLPCYESWFSTCIKHDWKRICTVPWYKFDPKQKRKPLDSIQNRVDGETLQNADAKCSAIGLRFVAFRLRFFDEPEFNRLVGQLDNKAALLSEASLELARECIRDFGDDANSIEVYCDRHGGRKHYSGVLCHTFTDETTWFEPLLESPECSRYRSSIDQRPLTIQFKVNGDSLYPSAAASLAAKWTREIFMEELNRYWARTLHQDLVPTAGYAVDAKRFAKLIRPAAEKLGYSESDWWRMK